MATKLDDLYEADFFAWTQLQARELDRFRRTRPNLPLDLRHLAEEIRDLGKEQRNSLRSWVRRIIEHLLLLEYSPAEAPRSHWGDEIAHFRADMEDRRTATLDRDLRRHLPALYGASRKLVARKLVEHGENEAAHRLPEDCPYTLDQILGDWWPPTVRDQPGRTPE